MRKLVIFGSFIMLLLTSCGGSGSGDGDGGANGSDSLAADFSGMNEFSLKPDGLNMKIMLPEVESSTGASIDPQIDHDAGDYLWFLSIGPRFQMIIEDFGKEEDKIGDEKRRLERLNTIFEIEYIVNEPQLIMYRRTLHDGQGGKPSYHCYGVVEIDGYSYVLRSGDEGSLKPIIEDMVKTIRSAKPIQEA